MLLRGAGVSVGGTKVGLSVKRPCRKVYRACFVGNDGMRCRPGLQTRGGLVSSIRTIIINKNNINNVFLQAFQLTVLARYLLGVPTP